METPNLCNFHTFNGNLSILPLLFPVLGYPTDPGIGQVPPFQGLCPTALHCVHPRTQCSHWQQCLVCFGLWFSSSETLKKRQQHFSSVYLGIKHFRKATQPWPYLQGAAGPRWRFDSISSLILLSSPQRCRAMNFLKQMSLSPCCGYRDLTATYLQSNLGTFCMCHGTPPCPLLLAPGMPWWTGMSSWFTEWCFWLYANGKFFSTSHFFFLQPVATKIQSST